LTLGTGLPSSGYGKKAPGKGDQGNVEFHRSHSSLGGEAMWSSSKERLVRSVTILAPIRLTTDLRNQRLPHHLSPNTITQYLTGSAAVKGSYVRVRIER